MNNTSDNPNITFYRRRLPHIMSAGNPVFITWRMKFTLPRHIVEAIEEKREDFQKRSQQWSEEYQKMQKYQFDNKLFAWFDDIIAKTENLPAMLTDSQVAAVIEDCLHYLDSRKYKLICYCIMPNHVHLLIIPLCTTSQLKDILPEITKSIKQYTSRRINVILNTKGAFWARESYDHLVRSDKELIRVFEYIIQNPVTAELVDNWRDWKYTWVTEL